MAISDRLRFIRQQKNISQTELAQLTNINVKSLSRYELGTTIPPANLIAVLANVLGVSVDYLINGEDADIKDKELYEKFKIIQSMSGEHKKMVLTFLEMVVRDTKARQAYS